MGQNLGGFERIPAIRLKKIIEMEEKNKHIFGIYGRCLEDNKNLDAVSKRLKKICGYTSKKEIEKRKLNNIFSEINKKLKEV